MLTTWMRLDEAMLREISQKKKGKYWMISLICSIIKKPNYRKIKTKTNSRNLTIELRQPWGRKEKERESNELW